MRPEDQYDMLRTGIYKQRHRIEKDKLFALAEVGQSFAVKIRVIANEREWYEHRSVDHTGLFNTLFEGWVPEGNVYIEMTGPASTMGDFWQRYNLICKRGYDENKC